MANEGARPEIPEPEGPLGRIIAGNLSNECILSEQFSFFSSLFMRILRLQIAGRSPMFDLVVKKF